MAFSMTICTEVSYGTELVLPECSEFSFHQTDRYLRGHGWQSVGESNTPKLNAAKLSGTPRSDWQIAHYRPPRGVYSSVRSSRGMMEHAMYEVQQVVPKWAG